MEGKTRASSRSRVEKVGRDKEDDGQLCKEVIAGDLLWIKIHGSSWWPAQVVDENTVSKSNKPSKRLRGDVLVRLYGSYKYMYASSNRSCLEFENILMENNGNHSEILKKALEQGIKSGRSREQLSTSKDATPKPTKVKANLLSEKPEKVRSNKRKQEEQKKFESNSPKALRSSPRRFQAATMLQTKGKNDNSHPDKSPEGKGKTKSKRQKLDEVQKEVEPSTPNTSQATTSVGGMSQELSARRVKVMQTLGLVAPSGSPFHRNGLISPTTVC